MAGYDDKQSPGQAIWDRLQDERLARFPFPPHGRIPNFAGAAEASRRLFDVAPWRDAGRIKVNPDSPLFRAWTPLPKDEDFNSDDWFRGEFASANGHGNARAIATLYGGLINGGEIGGKRLLSEAVIKDAIAEHWDDMDRMTNRHFRFGCGFMLSCPPFPFGGRRGNFGHTGIGGAVGFGDPQARLGFSYCGNRMAPIADMGPFAMPMVEAMYVAIN